MHATAALDRFELLRKIGAGGCASVWLGRHRETSALVAVKVAHDGTGRTDVAARFQREAELSARLAHRNLVRVFDYLHDAEGRAVLVMEYLRGETLDEVVSRRGRMPAPAAVASMVAVLRGLEHVHALGVVHRDLKPANVFLSVEPDGVVIPKLLDFGVAKATERTSIVLTQAGEVLGTPAYMSPEQVRGEQVGFASDIFAVGAMLYELLTGELAFRANSPHAAMVAILERTVPRHADIPEALWPVIERALQKDPAARYESVAALREALIEAADYTDTAGDAALVALSLTPAPLPTVSLASVPPIALADTAPAPALPRRAPWRWVSMGAAACALVLVAACAGGQSARASEPKAIARSAPPPQAEALPAPATAPATASNALATPHRKARHVARTPGF